MSNNKNASYGRNRSFGSGGGTPTSPKKKGEGGGGVGGDRNRPARRSASHDPHKLKEELAAADGDGFTAVATPKKPSSNYHSNNNSSNSNNSSTPRGRANPTSNFTRPRATQSFNKPRPTGSFKKTRENNNSNNGSHNNQRMHNSSNSFDGVTSISGYNKNRNNRRDDTQRRANSFHKPRPTKSFDARNDSENNNFRNNNNNNNNMSSSNKDNNHSPGVIPPYNNNNNSGNAAAAKRELYRRSTSRLTADDVELYCQGDGKSPAQRSVIRINAHVMMRERLSNLDPPTFDGEQQEGVDCWNPHAKCLWNDPTRREQIEQVMQQYPNAIPLHLKKRPRIKSSKLGDSTATATPTPTAASTTSITIPLSTASVITSDDVSDRDDSSLGTSMRSNSEQPSYCINDGGSVSIATMDDEDMNPLRKTLMLLNKLSWTTIDKLTPRLFAILEEDVPKLMPPSVSAPMVHSDDANNSNDSDNKQPTQGKHQQQEVLPMVMTILTMIVEKSQTEPHFSAMYAQLCKNLADRNTAWKRKILAHCQSEFEHDTAWHIARLDERLAARAANREANSVAAANGAAPMEDVSSFTNATEDMDRDYLVLQLRKKYLGHVQFLGELFKLQLIKLDILIWCLSRLLFSKEQADEDDLQCFAKLMTVVGEQAASLVKKGKCHAMAEEKWYQCWDHVYLLTGRPRKNKQSAANKPVAATDVVDAAKKVPPKISSRIKFMLVDLLELEENGWVQRRQNEKPKTIAEIHEEVREEEAAALRRSYSDDWGSSGSFAGNRRRVSSDDYATSPTTTKQQKHLPGADGFVEVPKRTLPRRAVSDVEVTELYSKPQHMKRKKPQTPVPSSPTPRSNTAISQVREFNATPKIVEYPDPQECKEKAKAMFKEYFIGGDMNDAILSIDELIGAGRDNDDNGSLERGAAVVESGVLLVLEMKQQDVQKFLAVVKRCLQQKKIESASVPLGLRDPLEFLSDIEIDAPLARSLLTSIVAYWVRQEVLSFNFLLDAPEYFLSDGNAAEFAAGVLKVRGDEVTDEDLTVVEKLMTDKDKQKYSTAKEMVAQHQNP